MAIYFVGEESQCLNGFPPLEDVPDQMVGGIDHERFSNMHMITLIPEMNFTCNGTIEKVTVVGKGNSKIQEGPNPMQLQIWRPENTTECYRRVKKFNITLSSSVCKKLRDNDTVSALAGAHNALLVLVCTPLKQDLVLVKPGDILGIEIPPKYSNNFELYSITESRLTSYVFKRGQSTTTLDLSKRTEETTSQPLIRPEINLKSGIHTWL